MFLTNRYTLNPNPSKGFTIVELVVVVAVSLIITAVVLSNQVGFRRSLDLTNVAYETAFAIREAQLYGTSVRGQGGNFTAGYGIHFEDTTPGSFILFRDRSGLPDGSGDGKYNLAHDSDIETFTLRGGVTITDFCRVHATNGNDNCWKDAGGGQVINLLDITFQRPDPDAGMFVNPCAACGLSDPPGSATITLTEQGAGPMGPTRIVEVLVNGQIRVK